jgi:predicted Zn-dependent protease
MRKSLSALLGCWLILLAGSANAADMSLASIGSGSGAFGAELPDLGGPAYAMVSRGDEVQIGHMVMRELREQNMIVEDPEVSDYIQQLGLKLAVQSRDDDQAFSYYVLREPIVNAFATFGGIICVNSGLILQTDNEAQLASVVAHETGHVVQRHMARGLMAESRMSMTTLAAMLAAVLIGAMAGGGGQAIEGAIAMGQGIALQQSINYTRSQEIEADAVGIQLLAGAGYDPQEMATFFETLGRDEGLAGEGFPALLRDHPAPSDRIATARAAADKLPRHPMQADSLAYAFFKERVRVLVTPPETHLAQYYESLRQRRELTPAERYGEALVQIQSGGPAGAATAVRTLGELQARYPQMTVLYSALGQALAGAGLREEALTQFARWSRLFPRNIPITVRYAETLLQADQPAQAHQILLDLFNNVDPSPAQIRLTALAASAAGDAGDAYYYMSEYHLAGGDLNLANQQLELALASPNLTTIQRQRFRARLDQVRGWLREQQQARRTRGS